MNHSTKKKWSSDTTHSSSKYLGLLTWQMKMWMSQRQSILKLIKTVRFKPDRATQTTSLYQRWRINWGGPNQRIQDPSSLKSHLNKVTLWAKFLRIVWFKIQNALKLKRHFKPNLAKSKPSHEKKVYSDKNTNSKPNLTMYLPKIRTSNSRSEWWKMNSRKKIN